jgi:hypothetical protein
MSPAFPTAGVIDHPAYGRVKYRVSEISLDPDTQVAQTIDLMKRYALEDAPKSALQADVARSIQTGDPLQDVWWWCKREGGRGMRFVRDEDSARPFQPLETITDQWRPIVESIARPTLLATTPNPQGDCDCFCTYGAAHLIARGVACAFCTVAASEQTPTEYSHVYLVAYPKSGGRVPLDLSHGPYAGWETENKFGKRMEWPVMPGTPAASLLLLAAGGFILYDILRGRRVN